MPDDSFSVFVVPPDELAKDSVEGYSRVETVIQEGIRRHLESGGEWFQSSKVTLDVRECRFEGNYARLEVSLSGLVNGDNVAVKNFEAEITAPVDADTMALATGGTAGLAAHKALDLALERLKSDNPTPHPNALDQKILFQILEYLDDVVGRTASPAGRKWNQIRKLRWIVAAALFVSVLGLGLARGGANSNGLLAGLMFGVLAVPIGFLLTHCWGLLMMPASFFESETAGKKAMLMTGVGSVGTLRVVMVIAIVFLAACLLGELFLVWGSANWN